MSICCTDEHLSSTHILNNEWATRILDDLYSMLKQSYPILWVFWCRVEMALPPDSELVTWRAGHNHCSVFELATVERQHVLQYKLSRVSASPVIVALHVKAHHVVAFSQEAFSPS